ncbi:MAG: bifunctional DNA-formamidopyrimidine glycosylase/DNA-(apurinic or apyrimidinic site) lyase [Candidatus Nanopelagicales bacterium]|nr:bifunctional DNA-formamidopyrimidine glycosylase/DNA-(apurinic or apyrimidinic site) lyase [Candidatus Nanopelagicales bacterium]
MPELPEVEVVRRGVQAWATGRDIASVQVLHARAVRRQEGSLGAELAGSSFHCASRRGKYLWLPLAGTERCLVVHLGMSGQLLVQSPAVEPERHLRVRLSFDDGAHELRFVDQRTFGGLHTDALVPDGAGGRVPAAVAHIARDPLDPAFDKAALVARLRGRQIEVKRALLDQSLVSGIGNIYADEALWRARIHGRRIASGIAPAQLHALIDQARAVMMEALAQGGTSFDALYVDVNGQSGYFSRSLRAYGQQGEPCHRCGTPIRREHFMNRSSFSCPRCQRPPRAVGR